MDDDADLAVGDAERESLPAHVEACDRRYRVLRKDLRAGGKRTAAELERLRRLVLLLVGLSILSAAGELAPGLKTAALAMVGRAVAGG